MSLMTSRIICLRREIRREFIWLRYSKIGYFLCAVGLLLSIAYAVHIVSSWNATAARWSTNFADNPIDLDSIRDALRAPMSVQQSRDGITINNTVQYQTVSLLRAEASVHYDTAIIGGLSFLTFTVLPIISLWIGMTVAGRDHKSGLNLTKSDTASQGIKWMAKICMVCMVLLIFSLIIALVLPPSVDIARALFAESPNAIQPVGIFEIVSIKNTSASLYGSIRGLTCATFVMCVFSTLGLLIGEVTKGRTIILAFGVALYYLAPLGNYLDPRNLLAAVGRKIFWFGGSFQPYEANLDLMSSSDAAILLLISAIVFSLVSGYIKVLRSRNLVLLRKQE